MSRRQGGDWEPAAEILSRAFAPRGEGSRTPNLMLAHLDARVALNCHPALRDDARSLRPDPSFGKQRLTQDDKLDGFSKNARTISHN